MRYALLFLLLTGFALSGCLIRWQRLDHPPRQTVLSAERVELPATFINGRPYVELKINGKGPFVFLVDTGSVGMVITPQVAREARISSSQKSTANVTGAGGQFENQSMGIVDRIETPGLSLRVAAVTIMTPESATLLDKHGDRFSGGIIGMSTLQDVLLEIDYPRQKVSVARAGSETPAQENGIPYREITPHVTIATPSARHATATALIDTGADDGIELADIDDYPMRVGLSKADECSVSIGGYWRPLFGQLAWDIRLGSAIWRDPEIYSANTNRIGSAALVSWKLVIDPTKKMIWLSDQNQMAITTWTGPLEPDGRPAVYGFAFIADGDAFIVKEVDPGSRAEHAGLKIDDRLLPEAVDPIPSGQSPENKLRQIRLHVVRGSEKLEITMSLSEPLPAITKSAGAAP
jgi:predicted aspartyl protease